MFNLDAEQRNVKELALYDCLSHAELNLMNYETYAGIHFDVDEGQHNNLSQIYDILKWMLDNKEFLGFIFIKIEDILELYRGLKNE